MLNLKAVLIINSLKGRSMFLSIDSQLIELKLLKLRDLGFSNLNMIEKFDILQNSCEIEKFLFQHGYGELMPIHDFECQENPFISCRSKERYIFNQNK